MNEDFDNIVDGPELEEDFDLDYEPDHDDRFDVDSALASVGWGMDEDYGDWDYSNDY
jgi:hypothetical protein